MAQLAAQDYFNRLQASGMSPFAHPDLAAAFPAALGMGGVNVPTSSANSGRQGSSDNKSNNKGRKEKKSNTNSNSHMAGNKNSLLAQSSSSSASSSSYKVYDFNKTKPSIFEAYRLTNIVFIHEATATINTITVI